MSALHPILLQNSILGCVPNPRIVGGIAILEIGRYFSRCWVRHGKPGPLSLILMAIEKAKLCAARHMTDCKTAVS
jgi:hypothetical protein